MPFKTRENEEIKMVIRRHWFVVINLFAFGALMAVLPPFVYFIMTNYIHIKELSFSYFVIGSSIYYMFVINMLYIGWLDYYLDAAIITSDRIVDIDQEGLFNRTVSEVHYSRVQDSTASTKGIVQNVLNFGDVHIQTAGASREFNLEKIPQPYKVAKLIIDIQQEVAKNSNHSHSHTSYDKNDNMASSENDSNGVNS